MKKTKLLIIVLVVVAFGAVAYVAAQNISDSYDDTTKIARSWRGTTTLGELRIEERSCDNSTFFCIASTTCSNGFGDGSYIIVARENASTTMKWKTSNTSCDKPQCEIDGGQVDHLSINTSADLSEYLAQNYCKSIGGRLPTTGELACMYTNRLVFGNNFVGGVYYWSIREHNSAQAKKAYISGGWDTYDDKTDRFPVRCVIGW